MHDGKSSAQPSLLKAQLLDEIWQSMLPLLKRKGLRQGITPLITSTAILEYYTFVSIHNLARRNDIHPMRLCQMAKLGTLALLHYRYTGLIVFIDVKRDTRYE